MSKNLSQIINVMKRMSLLLKNAGYSNEAHVFDQAISNIPENSELVKANMLEWYGGMGSLNDLILQKNGEMLFDENEEFDKCRETLYLMLKSK